MLPRFEKIKTELGTLTIHESVANSPLAKLLSRGWETLSAFPSYQTIRATAHTTVVKFMVPGVGSDRCLYAKRFLRRSWKDALKELVRSSRAMRAFQGALLLTDHDFPTAPVVALFEGEGENNFLVTEEIPNAHTIYQLLETIPADKHELQAVLSKREMFLRLAELLARMHATGVYHHDLRVGNILVNRDTKEVFFIDTDRVSFERPRQLTYIVKNLAQLNLVIMPQITVTDRLRFFRMYQKFAGIPQIKAREIFSRSEARSRYKLLQALPKHLHRTAATLPYSELLALAYNSLYKKSSSL